MNVSAFFIFMLVIVIIQLSNINIMKIGSQISDKYLKLFIQKNDLSSVVEFLNFLQDDGIVQFYKFCQNQNCAIDLGVKTVEELPKKLLFHGAQKAQEILTPFAQECELSAVYATNNPNYAIFLAVINLYDASAGVVANERSTELIIDIDFVNGQSKLTNGFVHILSANKFHYTTNCEFQANCAINVLFSIPVSPSDLTVPICVSE